MYDVTANGQRFLMPEENSGAPATEIQGSPQLVRGAEAASAKLSPQIPGFASSWKAW